jgi:hypothetical protein
MSNEKRPLVVKRQLDQIKKHLNKPAEAPSPRPTAEEVETVDEARVKARISLKAPKDWKPKAEKTAAASKPKKEVSSSESDSEAPGIYGQLLKHKDLRGAPKIKFENGKSHEVSPAHRDKVLDKFRSLHGAGKSPDARDKIIKHAGASHENFMQHVNNTYTPEKRHPMSAVKEDQDISNANSINESALSDDRVAAAKRASRLLSKANKTGKPEHFGDYHNAKADYHEVKARIAAAQRSWNPRSIEQEKHHLGIVDDHTSKAKNYYADAELAKQGKDTKTSLNNSVEYEFIEKLELAVQEGKLSQDDMDLLVQNMEKIEEAAPVFNVVHPDHGVVGTHSYATGFVPSKPGLGFKAGKTIPNGTKIVRPSSSIKYTGPGSTTKEEVEQMDEISAALAKRYINRSADDQDALADRRATLETVAEEAQTPAPERHYVTPATEANRFRGVESSIREIMSQNRDIRKIAKEEEFNRNK